MVRRIRLLVLVAALACGGLGGWITMSSRAAGDVSVTWSERSPRCTGTEVRQRPSGPVVEAVAGMRCVVTVDVRNDSGSDVRLVDVLVPFLGERGGAVVKAGNTDHVLGPDGVDATYPVDLALAPDESHRFEVVVLFGPSGCNDSGTATFYDWPRVAISVLGRSHTRLAADDFVFHRDGATPGCRRM